MAEPILIEAQPASGFADEPVSIKVTGLRPGKRATLQLNSRDEEGRAWHSQADFEASPSGEVNPGTQPALSGTYDGLDPTGLLWSMRPEGTDKPTAFAKEKADPLRITLSVHVEGETLSSLDLNRHYRAPGVERTVLEGEGLVGTFFAGKDGKPGPGVVYLHGTDARIREDVASLLASRGFPTLALAYFGQKGLPDELVMIPLEYIQSGVEWLQAQEVVREGGVTVFGKSRGGELALLAGSKFESVTSVIALVPSGVVFQGLHENPRNREVQSAWSIGGKPVPFVPLKMGLANLAAFIFNRMISRPVSTTSMYERSLKDTGAVHRATLKVENIGGPVLMVSGSEDRVWPSGKLCRMVTDRLGKLGYPHPFRHMEFEGAGHSFGLPYLPTTVNQKTVSGGLTLDFGGSAEPTARAAVSSWNGIKDFLNSLSDWR